MVLCANVSRHISEASLLAFVPVSLQHIGVVHQVLKAVESVNTVLNASLKAD